MPRALYQHGHSTFQLCLYIYNRVVMEALLQPLDPRPIEYIYSIVIFANLESGGKLGRRIKNSQVAGCVM